MEETKKQYKCEVCDGKGWRKKRTEKKKQYKCETCGYEFDSMAHELRCLKCDSRRVVSSNGEQLTHKPPKITNVRVPFLRLVSAMNTINKQYDIFDKLERLGNMLKKEGDNDLAKNIKELNDAAFNYAINTKMDLIVIEDFFKEHTEHKVL